MSGQLDELVLCRFNGGLSLRCVGLDREGWDSSDNLGTMTVLLSVIEVPGGNFEAMFFNVDVGEISMSISPLIYLKNEMSNYTYLKDGNL